MPNYTLDLSTILAVFHAQRRTGELRAENVRLRNRGSFQVQIAFYNGKDVSYLIEDASGQPFAEGDTAKQLLMRLERIEWHGHHSKSRIKQDQLPGPYRSIAHLTSCFGEMSGH